MLLKLLPDVHTTEDITFQKVKTFMERARSRCVYLTDVLISENEAVKCLNQVLSGIIIAVTCDTAKNLFQGLIFVYFVHPFNVGDLCLIDQELLEVKRIGVWSTIFSNIRAICEQEQIIYPNSVLSLKNLINYKTSFNWRDCIEILCSPDKKITVPLKHKLENYLREENEKFTSNCHSVEILEMGDKAKIAIHIKHKLKTTQGWTHFECLKEKEKRRFELAIYVQNLVKQLEFGTGTGAPESAEIEDFYTRG
ncbi:mechanosensitive ion channel protein 10-like [Silene latifolia]|uniref:mechanosensitive ion channel protein 10-like n=1 Tax=Silene latifolia TaxID=37657 RepID=UPI003D7834D8